MKQVFWTLMIVCGASLVFAAETPRLYRVQQDGKVGFIDARGQIVIPINCVAESPLPACRHRFRIQRSL
jgi:hypothetical protein